jgi:hypothetical protein
MFMNGSAAIVKRMQPIANVRGLTPRARALDPIPRPLRRAARPAVAAWLELIFIKGAYFFINFESSIE